MADRPNVILITAHDLGQHLGCYGIATVDTPHIDRLASEGLRFNRSFCVNPGCSPSRASLATGRFPHSHGVMGLTHSLFAWDLREGECHIQRRFQQAGYRTALNGVCHEAPDPRKLGFDDYLSTEPGHPDPDRARAMKLADSTGAYLHHRAGEDQPFYLQVGFFEPHRDTSHPTHWPPTHRPARREATVPQSLRHDLEAWREFAYFEASIRTVDDAVGQIMAELDAAGLADDTLVIFTSDHGIPFARAKCSVYDPGLEVPLILRWPNGPWAAGTIQDAMVSNVDYLPTLCDLLGMPTPDNHQGHNYAPLLRGEDQTPRDHVFAELNFHDYYDPLRVIRTERHKLIVAFAYNKGFMDPSQQWKPMTTPITPPELANQGRHALVELYDLQADPLEMNNLADDPAHDAVRARLLGRLHDWMVQTDDPLLTGVPTPPMHRMALDVLRKHGG